MSKSLKQTPNWRRCQRFKANRRGYISLISRLLTDLSFVVVDPRITFEGIESR